MDEPYGVLEAVESLRLTYNQRRGFPKYSFISSTIAFLSIQFYFDTLFRTILLRCI